MRDQDKKRGYQKGAKKKAWRETVDRLPGFTEGCDDEAVAALDIIRKKATPTTLASEFEGALALFFELGMRQSIAEAHGIALGPLTVEAADAQGVLTQVCKTLNKYAKRRRHRQTMALSADLLDGLIQIYGDEDLTAQQRRPLIRDLFTARGAFIFEDDLKKLAISNEEISAPGAGGKVDAAHKRLGKVLRRSPTTLRERRELRGRLGATPPLFEARDVTRSVIRRVFEKMQEWSREDAEVAAAFWECVGRNRPRSPSEFIVPGKVADLFNRAVATPGEVEEAPLPKATGPLGDLRKSGVRRRAKAKGIGRS